MGNDHEEVEVTDSMIRSARPRWPAWVAFFVALVGGAAASLYLRNELQGARAQAAATNVKVLEAQGKLETSQRSQAEAEARLDKLAAEKTEMVALQHELARDVQAKEEELAKVKATADELEEKMKAEIASGDIRLSRANGRLKVDLVDKILFDSGDARISKRGEGVLARVGAVLSRIEDKQIQVAGHTDDAPISARLVERYPTNWELSTSRATNVVRFLEEKAHVPPARLAASGYGPFHPISPNTTPRGRARNRRIEILLAPAFDPMPSNLESAKPAPVKVAKPGPIRRKPAHNKYAKKQLP